MKIELFGRPAIPWIAVGIELEKCIGNKGSLRIKLNAFFKWLVVNRPAFITTTGGKTKHKQ